MQGEVPGWLGSGLWRGWKAAMVLVVLCLSVYLPGFTSTPAVDRDESRFAQASRQMLESGDFVVPRVQGKPRLNKPPLIYWLQAGSAWVLTGGDVSQDEVWMYRVPSLLAAIGVVLATWRLGAGVYGPFAGVLAGATIAVAPVFWWEARQARADMVLVLCTVVAVGVVARFLGKADIGGFGHAARMSWSDAVILWLSVGAGVMTKGPVTLLVVVLGVLAVALVRKRWRWLGGLRPIVGLLIVSMCVLPWVWLVTRQVGFDVWLKTVIDETLGRSLEPKEGHGGFPGYHMLLLPLLLFPGSVFVGVGVWKALHERTGVTLLCFVVPTWMVMELVGTKLPHYTMPVYPLLAILTSGACCVGASGMQELMGNRVVRWAIAAWVLAVPMFAVCAACVLGFAVNERGWLLVVGVVTCGVALAFLFVGAAAVGLKAGDWPRTMAAALLTFAVSAAMLGLAAPRIEQLWVTRALARQIRHIDPAAQYPLAAVGSDSSRGLVGFHEDSLVFATRGRVERIMPAELDEWFQRNPAGHAIVPAAMLVAQGKYVPITRASGFNYSKGRIVHLCIAGVRP